MLFPNSRTTFVSTCQWKVLNNSIKYFWLQNRILSC